jgi:hypothetical protein
LQTDFPQKKIRTLRSDGYLTDIALKVTNQCRHSTQIPGLVREAQAEDSN